MCPKVEIIFKMVPWKLIRIKDFQTKADCVRFVHPIMNWSSSIFTDIQCGWRFLSLSQTHIRNWAPTDIMTSHSTTLWTQSIFLAQFQNENRTVVRSTDPRASRDITILYCSQEELNFFNSQVTRWSSHRWQFEEFGCGDSDKAGFSANWTPTSVKLVTSSTATVQRGLQHTVSWRETNTVVKK